VLPQVLPDRWKVPKSRITGWALVANVAGDIVLDLRVGGTSICGATPPTLTGAASATGVPDATWTTEFAEGTYIDLVVVSYATLQKVEINLDFERVR
jgi:hypothetical protein